MVVNVIRAFLTKLLGNLFKNKKQIKLGIYGPPMLVRQLWLIESARTG